MKKRRRRGRTLDGEHAAEVVVLVGHVVVREEGVPPLLQGSGFRVQGSGFRGQGAGVSVQIPEVVGLVGHVVVCEKGVPPPGKGNSNSIARGRFT